MPDPVNIEQTLSFDCSECHILPVITALHLEDGIDLSESLCKAIGFTCEFTALNSQYNSLRLVLKSNGLRCDTDFFSGSVPFEALPSLRAMIDLILGDTK